MLDTTKRTIATLTAAACLGGAGWAIASSSNGSSGSSTSTDSTAATDSAIAANTGTATYGAPQGQRPQQTEVTGDAAAKITAAVLAKVPGATIERIEQDAQGYHAHITGSDGTRATVRLNAQFAVTAVETGRGPGGMPGQGGLGGQRPDETPLTGDKAAKVKAAALAKLPGATIVRVETDADGDAYEAHVTKADGSRATVKLDSSFTVTAVEDR
jgi:uncharacterized membrane protein YkoI